MNGKEQRQKISQPKLIPYRLYVFFAVLTTTVAFSIYLFILQWKNGFSVSGVDIQMLPRSSDVTANLKLMFNGYKSGYWRTIWGYGSFFLMGCTFLFIGQNLLKWIFFNKNSNSATIETLNFFEKISLSYILGSLFMSLAWLGLGTFGFLNSILAVTLGILGCGFFWSSFFGTRRAFNMPLEKLKISFWDWVKQSGLTEKVMFVSLCVILLALSVTAVRPQSYSDTLLTHLTLPNFYLNEGHFSTYPYHIHSYFPQNTEMLVVWALLLKSEVAAALTIWGFLVSLVFLVYGFLKRYTSDFVALVSIFTFLSAPVFVWFSTTVKSDFPAGLFILAHYFALAGAWDKRTNETSGSKRWMILAGILCGGAIGHKLTAMPIALISSVFVIGYDLYQKRKKNIATSLTTYWFIGLLAAISPWLIRTLITTGNPIYPYFNDLIGVHPIKPWHAAVAQRGSILSQGFDGIINFVRGILGSFGTNSQIQFPDWGPMGLLGLLGLVCIGKITHKEIFLLVIAASLSFLSMLFYSLEIRYYIGLLILIIPIPFGFYLNAVFVSIPLKPIHVGVAFAILLCAFLNLLGTGTIKLMRSNLAFTLSGFSPGNFLTTDVGADDIRWMTYLINTRTHSNEKVLFAGINYAYGLNNRFVFSSDLDKDILGEIAEQSTDANDLKNKLADKGINHILINLSRYSSTGNPPNKNLQISQNGLKNINDLINNHATLRFYTPNRNILWFSLKNSTTVDLQPIVLTQSDARENPQKYSEYIKPIFREKNNVLARQMCETMINTEMLWQTKLYGWRWFGTLLLIEGKKDEAKNVMLDGISKYPKEPESYLNLALIYLYLGEKGEISELLNRAYAFGGRKILEIDPDFKPLLPYVNP